jgi:hypothetical protein
VIAVVCCVSGLGAQSLGEIAKQTQTERDAKKADSHATSPKTYTTDSLKADPVSPPPVAADAPKPAGAAESAIEQDRKDEAYWRGRLQVLRDKFAADDKQAGVVRDALSRTSSKLEPNLPSLAVFGAETARLTNEMRKWNAILDDDLRAITDLREEGRRAGALPGWLR